MTTQPSRAIAGGQLRAVLFDLDGTLVDTEPRWMSAEYALVDQFGGAWSDAHAKTLVGSDLVRAAEYLRDVGGVRLEPADIVARMLHSVVGDVRDSMPWRPGARELLADSRRAGLACALVTMSYRSLADAVVAQLPAGSFDTVVTGDQVMRGKPDPEPYLTACARLGVAAADTVAIEDSPTGVASARAAGCLVVAVPLHVPIRPAAGLIVLETLAGVQAGDLAAFVEARAG